MKLVLIAGDEGVAELARESEIGLMTHGLSIRGGLAPRVKFLDSFDLEISANDGENILQLTSATMISARPVGDGKFGARRMPFSSPNEKKEIEPEGFSEDALEGCGDVHHESSAEPSFHAPLSRRDLPPLIGRRRCPLIDVRGDGREFFLRAGIEPGVALTRLADSRDLVWITSFALKRNCRDKCEEACVSFQGSGEFGESVWLESGESCSARQD